METENLISNASAQYVRYCGHRVGWLGKLRPSKLQLPVPEIGLKAADVGASHHAV
jgi:hypothetical protein